MNAQKIIPILTSLILLAGCPAQPGAPGPAMTDHNCPSSSPGVDITINYNGATITVAPPNKKVDEGDVLVFNLVGANDVWVSTSGKTPSDGWLNGSGRKKDGKPASEKFYICVPYGLFPDDAKEGDEKEFEYNVDAVGKPQLDPIVTVRRL
jgi:hypothetical protein